MGKDSQFDSIVQPRSACKGEHRKAPRERAVSHAFIAEREGGFNPARFKVDDCRGPLVMEGPRQREARPIILAPRKKRQ